MVNETCNLTVKVSDILAEFLVLKEIKTVFGIIGSANAHIFDSITNRGYTKIVCVHHEQAAVIAMGAHYRTSGKLSAAIVTAGAGSSNAITGVVSNWADSIPGFIISGQEQSYHIKNYEGMRMYGIQGFNSPKMVSDITKYSKTILDENTLQDELEHAYKSTISGRPGPVWLDFPSEIQSKKITKRPWNQEQSYIPIVSDNIKSDIEHIRKCISESNRPVIWGGHGIRLSNAKEEFRTLVYTLKIPTILTWSGIDLLSENNPFYFGRAGVTGHRNSNFIIQNSDLILVLGSRLSLLQAGYDITKLSPNAKIIIIDIDETELNKNKSICYKSIRMDCKEFIINLQENAVPINCPDWISYCNKIKTEYPLNESSHIDGGVGYLNSYHLINDMCKYLKQDQIITTDMGTGLLSGHYSIKLTENQTMFTSLGLGEMGYGLPSAIGAAFSSPNRQVLCLNCDGGMMMNIQELQTIIHHKLPIKIIIFNNDGYLMIKHTQKLLFKGSYCAVNNDTGVSLPDFTKVGIAFGFDTYQLRHWEDVDATFTKFFSDMKPAICEVFMNPEQEFTPKVKGVLQTNGSILPASLEEMSPLLPYNEIKDVMKWGLSEQSKHILR